MKIKIDKELFQWEQNREVFVDFDEDEPRVPYVQFYNSKTQKCPLVLLEDNRAFIPNELLEESLPITVLACTDTKVLARKEFRVLKRPKPDGFDDSSQQLIKLNTLLGGNI